MNKKKEFLKVSVAIIVAIVFVIPGSSMFANTGKQPVENEINDIDSIDMSYAKDVSVFSTAKNSDGINDEKPSDDVDWWPMFHHDQEHSGYSTSTAPDTNDVLWKYTTDDDVQSSPAIVDGNVFVASYDGKVYCLDALDGYEIWKYDTYTFVRSSPAVVDGKVYIGTWDGYVYCLDASDGHKIWKYDVGTYIWSSPTVVDGMVFIGSYRGNSESNTVHCLDASDGSLIWGFSTRYVAHVSSSPAVVDGMVFVGTHYGDVYCLDASDGHEIWRHFTDDDRLSGSPAVVDGKVFIGAWQGPVYCLDASDGHEIWKYQTGSHVLSSPAVADGKVFVSSQDNNIYCLNESDGLLIWKHTTGDHTYSSPAVADGKVFVSSQDNNIYCLNESDGLLIWKYTTGDKVYSSPAVVDGKVFVGSDDHNIYCFGSFPDHDIGVRSIDSPVSGRADVFTPKVTVVNYGINNETNVPVNMQITKTGVGIEYDETVYIDINIGETKTVTFPEWVPDDIPILCPIDYDVTACTQLDGDEYPSNDCKTVVITLQYLHDVGVESITQPSGGNVELGGDTEWLYFHTGYDDNAIGHKDGAYEAAIRLTPDELEDYDKWQFNSVKWYHHESATHSGNIKIYASGTSIHPGDLITSEPYTVTGDGWKEIPLSEAVTIDAGEDIWVSVEITHAPGEYPIGVDAGPPIDGKGGWVSDDNGSSWDELQDLGLDFNWCIEAKVEEVSLFILTPGEYPVEGIVKNYGIYTEMNFNVNATIWLIEDRDTIFYADDFMVTTDMNPGDAMTVMFDNVTFSDTDRGEYRLDITTELVGDEYPENDQKHILFTVVTPDTIPPVTTHDFDGTMGDNGWYVSDVIVTLTATDDFSGVNVTWYRISERSWEIYTDSITVSDGGRYTIEYYSVDCAGNEEEIQSADFKIDQTPPTIDLTWDEENSKLVADVDDETSGVAKVEFYLNDEYLGEVTEAPYEWTVPNPKQGDKGQAIVYDNAGNNEISAEIDVVSQSQIHSSSSSLPWSFSWLLGLW